jgi:ATP-dependent protease ClpP protease subunit
MFDFDKATGEMFIYDDIGPSWMGMIGADDVVSSLRSYSGRVTVRINSPGGSVDEAVAIYNALDRHSGGVDVAIDSLAASAASYIAMVGEKITIADGAAVMIHSPWTLAVGNAAELRKTADVLDQYESRISGAYQKRLKKSDEEMKALLMEETWFTAAQAVESGIADSLGNYAVEPIAVASGRFMKTPDRFLAKVGGGTRTAYPYSRKSAEIRLARSK